LLSYIRDIVHTDSATESFRLSLRRVRINADQAANFRLTREIEWMTVDHDDQAGFLQVLGFMNVEKCVY
jgi:hypothetical protein